MATSTATTTTLPSMTIYGPSKPSTLLLQTTDELIDISSSELATSPTVATSHHAPLTTSTTPSVPPSCHLCVSQLPSDFAPTTKGLSICRLCRREFCPVHKATDRTVCSADHARDFQERLEKMQGVAPVFRGRKASIAGGIKDVKIDSWRRNVSDRTSATHVDRLSRQIPSWSWSHLAESHNTDEVLIETKDVVGADIAV